MTTEVFDAAVAVARRVGYRNITRRLLAEELASKSEWGRDVERTMNYLINEGGMVALIDQVVEAKDRLALPPGKRGYTRAHIWKKHNQNDIVTAAYRKAVTDGLYSLSMPKVAADTGFSVGTLRNYFGSIEGLRQQVVAFAHRHGNNTIATEFKIGQQYGSPEKIKAAAAK